MARLETIQGGRLGLNTKLNNNIINQRLRQGKTSTTNSLMKSYQSNPNYELIINDDGTKSYVDKENYIYYYKKKYKKDKRWYAFSYCCNL